MRGARAISGLRDRAHTGGHLNVTPLIDIVMVLIIFFLLVGQLAMDRQGDVDLPESVSGEAATPGSASIAVAVERDGRLVIDGRTTQPEKLTAVLRVMAAQQAGAPVQIRADKGAAFGDVRTVVNACREAGIATVELATAQAAESRGTNGGAP